MEFLWTNNVTPPKFPSLKGDLTTDVLVIGGGMAGILTAMFLQEAGASYVLVEAKNIGSGITKGTTAVLTAQHDTLYQDITKKFGTQKARLYLDANLNAVKHFRNLSQKITCDFEEKPSLIYSVDDLKLMEREIEALNQLGFAAEFTKDTPMPFPVAGAVKYPGMAQFHPLKFLYGIAKDLTIYENTFVKKLDETTAYTDNGTIRAKKVIVATHFPFINKNGCYFMKEYQKRSYVIALENALQLDCTIEDIAKNGMYFRNYGDYLLIGGGDHRTGKNGECFKEPRNFAAKYFPKATEKFAWANQDCVSLDGVPYIGAYSKHLPNVFVASGFNLWGMTTSMVAADILTDMVLDRKNKYAKAFLPNRNILTGQLFANMGTTLLDFATPSLKRCSHLGCTLKWNPNEHSWDCPCHGSRFDEHGKLINNPAMRNSHVE